MEWGCEGDRPKSCHPMRGYLFIFWLFLFVLFLVFKNHHLTIRATDASPSLRWVVDGCIYSTSSAIPSFLYGYEWKIIGYCSLTSYHLVIILHMFYFVVFHCFCVSLCHESQSVAQSHWYFIQILCQLKKCKRLTRNLCERSLYLTLQNRYFCSLDDVKNHINT